MKQNLPKFMQLQLCAYEVDNVEIDNIEQRNNCISFWLMKRFTPIKSAEQLAH